uniref:Uncharacterized protein n=1 Tax=Oryza brachyantha TaxID=4533 RepID=J3LDD8_ORYBR
MDNAAAGVLPLLCATTWLEGTTVMVFVEVVELVGLSALIGLASAAHAQLRWLRPPDFLAPPPDAAAPSAAESQ